MTHCQACAAVETKKHHAPGHDGLEPTGKKFDYKPFAQSVAKVTEYKCAACGTLWRYEDDKNDDFAGWSIGD